MRRRLAASLVAALVLTGTAACGDDAKKKDDAAGASSDSISGVTVTGDLGEQPKVKTAKFSVRKLTSAELVKGDGDEVDDKSIVSARIGIFDSDGKLVQGNYDANEPQQINLASDTGPAVQALIGSHAGSRVAVAAPVTDVAGPKGAPDAGLEPDESMLFVFDILKILPPEVPLKPGGPLKDGEEPTVKTQGDSVTGLDFKDSPEGQPSEFKSITLKQGDGPAVKEGANISVNYFGAVWGRGDTPFDSSFERGQPASFTLAKGQLIDGWVKGLVGVKQGSRVMLVIPSDLGYGDQGSPPNIPGKATLVFVIDVIKAG
jgi:peptidylprolyl isomerase